ncbi:unnamed protein product [Heterosigma akashiwo]
MVAVYVDDLVISSSHPSIVSDLKSSFASRFKITDLGRDWLCNHALGDSPIVWASKLQTAVSTSTVEAEYLALRSAVKDIMWLRHLLVDLGCPQTDPTPMVEDNSACIE